MSLRAVRPLRFPRSRAATYDVKCGALAEAFLSDTPAAGAPEYQVELATRIQETIEDFLSEVLGGDR